MEGINNEKLKDLPGVSPKVKDFISEYIIPVVEPFENVELKFLGTGRHLRDMIVL